LNQEVDFLEVVKAALNLATQREKLDQASLRDPLTGILRREAILKVA
jgi:hypothetical protein